VCHPTVVALDYARILIIGGSDDEDEYPDISVADAVWELNVQVGNWARRATMNHARFACTAAVLANGLVAGRGRRRWAVKSFQDPMYNYFLQLITEGIYRVMHRLYRLQLGGDVDERPSTTAEIWDPVADRWSILSGPAGDGCTPLACSIVNLLSMALVYGRAGRLTTFSGLGSPAMAVARYLHAGCLLPSGRYVVMGGLGAEGGGGCAMHHAECWDPAYARWQRN
jgi:hypothetical protein